LSHDLAKGLNSKQFFYEYYDMVCLPNSPIRGLRGIVIIFCALYVLLVLMRHSFLSRIRLVAAPLAIAGLFTASLPPQSATARAGNDYQACAAALRDAGIAEAQAATACASALRPVEVSTCVSSINGGAIAADDALSGCRRVRRPLEFATCVASISATENAAAPQVLDNCRRSLLPARFAECVVGLRSELNFNANRAMRTCIASTDGEQDSLPTSDASEP
jgi:hypothetical protein